MNIAIMQPYFLPYIGYFQLINSVDVFVIYDNIEYTKKGWINRNRILVNNNGKYFTIPLKKASDYLLIRERNLADTSSKDIQKIVKTIEMSYSKAPYFKEVFPILKNILLNNEFNLFKYIKLALTNILNYLEIKTEVVISSEIAIDHSLKSQEKVIAICTELNADMYINPIGGVKLYSNDDFLFKNINLSFLQTHPIVYKQFDNDFIPWLSIIDVLMFNSKEETMILLNQYELI